MMTFFISERWLGFIVGWVVSYLVLYFIYLLSKRGEKSEAEDDKP